MLMHKVTDMVDWTATSLRWIILLGLALSLATSHTGTAAATVVLVLAGAWNLVLTALITFNYRLPEQNILSVLVDILTSSFFFAFSGSLNGNAGWVGLLPVATAGVLFQVRGAIIVAVVSVMLQGLLALPVSSVTSTLVFVLSILPLYLGIGLLEGYALFQMQKRTGKIKLPKTKNRENQGEAMHRIDLVGDDPHRSIYKIISLLSSSLNYRRVLDATLDLSLEALSTVNHTDERLVSAVMLFSGDHKEGNKLHIGPAHCFTPSDMRITLEGNSGVLGKAIESSDPCLTVSPANDPELSRIVTMRTCQSAYCIPLHNGLDTYGVLVYGHPVKDFFTQANREILDVLGNQAMVAIENARLFRELEQEKERILDIQEEARKKLARDLHDGPTQSVSALAMRVNYARRLLERDAKAAAEELFKIEEMARRTTKEIRHMLFTLRPLVLESHGLIAALESMAEKMHDTFNQQVIIEANPDIIPQLEISKQGVIFYIAEEAVTNARKHAKADHVWVRLKGLSQGLVLLEIVDDGQGFDPSATNADYENRGSLGMVNMRERTDLINGVLKIESRPGYGTRIRVFVPLTEEAADRLRNGSQTG
jgi:signal transduction histidine kinase